MMSYEKHFIRTTDGKHSLMQYDYMYSGAIDYKVSTELILMDTDIEWDIGLMQDYRYSTMNEGECWVA